MARYRYGRRTRSRVVTLVSATFDAADNATALPNAETGQAWTANNGTWGVSGGAAYTSVAAGGSFATVPTPADAQAEASLVAVPASLTAGIVFRFTDANNHWRYYQGSSGVTLEKVVAGAATSRGFVENAKAAGTRYIVRFVGSSILCYANGLLTHAITDSDLASGARCGLFINNDAGVRWDNFRVTR